MAVHLQAMDAGESQAQTGETSGTRRGTALACAIVFLFAFALRWTHLQAAQDTVYPSQLAFLEDARYYASWSEEIAAGEIVGTGSFFMGPLYPYSLALARPLAAASPVVQADGRTLYDFSHAYLIQALIGALSCVLIWGMTRSLMGVWQAWLAALLAATQRVFIYYDGLLMPSSQALFVILGALALILVAQRRGSGRWWFVCGVALGLAALAKAPSLLLVPGVVLWLLAGDRQPAWRTRLQRVGLLLLGCLPVIGLATAHNFAADGDLVLISANAGPNLWIGNGPQASGAHAGVTTRFESAKLDFHRFGKQRSPGEPPASEVSRQLTRDAFDYMAAHPAQAASLFWKKFRMFWNAVEVGTTDQFEFFKRNSAVLRAPLPGFGWIAPLGLVGFVLMLRRWRRYWPLHLLVLTQAASFTLFFMLGRYRLASVACLIVFAVAAVDWGLVTWRARQAKTLAISLLGLVLATLFVNWPIAGMGPERGFANQHYLLAREAEASGGEALPLYLKALDANWREGDLSLRQEAATHLRVGDAEALTRHPRKARAHYERARETCERMSQDFRYRAPLLRDIERRLQALGGG